MKALLTVLVGACAAFAASFAAFSAPVGHGGMVMLVGDDAVHVFKTNGVFRLDGAGAVDVLVVGGGGGGATARSSGGGGGGGGVVYRQNVALTAGEYEIVVGAGGAGSYTNEQGRATDPGKGESSYAFKSSAFEIVAAGGGIGGKNTFGGDGASGGGGGAYTLTNPSTKRGGNATGGGFPGGASTNTSAVVGFSGGGGGAGHAGYNGVYPYDSVNGGRGGDGVSCDITGEAKYYGGGGGGGFSVSSGSSKYEQCVSGGLGGGGNGSGNKSTTVVYAGGDGEPNTGGGGGGGSGGAKGDRSLMGSGGNGGSGVVIVRCHGCASAWRNAQIADATGGAVSKSGAWRIHSFMEDGVFMLPQDAYVEILLVGGGGGGGAGRSSGGGGAGGQVLHLTNLVLAAGSYDVTVGLGGRGAITNASGAIPPNATDYHSKPGDVTRFSFASEVADGDWAKSLVSFSAEGGAPGGVGNMAPGPAGYNGGGASAKCRVDPGRTAGGVATSASGFAGGSSTNASATIGHSGGGGGAGHAGYDGIYPYDSTWGGRGGDGVACDITGATVYYGGGGGGGFASSDITGDEGLDKCVPGGLGGGGNGSGYRSTTVPYLGGDGTPGLGGGGGGGGACPTGSSSKMGLGGHGGSGVVILRYRRKLQGCVILFR